MERSQSFQSSKLIPQSSSEVDFTKNTPRGPVDSTLELPQELIDLIIQDTDGWPVTLSNLCLVSTSFLTKARQLLYCDISVLNEYHEEIACSGFRLNSKQATKLLITLVKHNPMLANDIRSWHQVSYPQIDLEEYRNLLKQGLEKMVHLKSLTFMRPYWQNIHLYFPTKCKFQIETFGIGDQVGYTKSGDSKETESAIIRFLSSQPQIKTLYLDNFCEYFDYSVLQTHQLQALTGNRKTIEHILPHQPQVTTLTWIPDTDILGEDTLALSAQIASAFLQIHTLTLDMGFGNPNFPDLHPDGRCRRPSLQLIAPYLTSLRVLCLHLEDALPANYEEHYVASNLPNLRVLIWTSKYASFLEKSAQVTLIKVLFSRPTKLKAVYIKSAEPKLHLQVFHSALSPPYYLCWEPEKPEPRVVDFDGAITGHGVVGWYY